MRDLTALFVLSLGVVAWLASFVLVALGRSGSPPSSAASTSFRETLEAVCAELRNLPLLRDLSAQSARRTRRTCLLRELPQLLDIVMLGLLSGLSFDASLELYCGNGGAVRVGTPHEIATEVSVNTAYGVERVVRYAFEAASSRRNHLTLVHKHNVLVNAGHMWRRIVDEVGREYPGVSVDYCHIDAATIYMVTDPSRFDVIVTDNLFGDILTDEAGAVTGGIGLSASANLNPSREYPSMFEPVHGSAPDIAGQGIADPTATISSVALMLDFMGMTQEATRVQAAIDADMAERARAARDGQALRRSTSQIGDDIAARL